jgi:hypothetical protein
VITAQTPLPPVLSHISLHLTILPVVFISRLPRLVVMAIRANTPMSKSRKHHLYVSNLLVVDGVTAKLGLARNYMSGNVENGDPKESVPRERNVD